MSKLLTPPELARARRELYVYQQSTPTQGDALDAILGHVDAQQDEIASLHSKLRRDRDAISILYVGNKARLPDGKIDVDAVIDGVLGDQP